MLMYAYHTATHSSTNLSHFELMFGRPPCTIPFQNSHKFDTTSYASYLKAKHQTMQDFVQANLANLLSSRSSNMTVTLSHVPLKWVTLHGYPYEQLGNHGHTRLEKGLSLS